MRVNLSKDLLASFTGEGAKQLPRIAAFHELNGNPEVAGAVNIAKNVSPSLSR